MTLAIIISPYNAPTAAERAANVRLGIALARWAAAQGYTPVGWWCDVDPDAPPADDPETRAAALARSAERARMVGTADGVVVLPEWVAPTAGMEADQWAHLRGRIEGVPGRCGIWRVSLADLTPYLLPEPVPTVPRAAVQAAVDEMEARFDGVRDSVDPHRRGIASGIAQVADIVATHTGVTPSEVQ